MKHRLLPDQHADSFHAIDIETLYDRGIRGLILDIDNTMEPYFEPEPTQKTRETLDAMRAKGFVLYIVSNGRESRVKVFNRELKLPFFCHAGKPGAKGFLTALEHLQLPREQVAVVGDQIFTDVWGGNRLGLYTILVKQVSPRDEWMTAVKRPLEKIVLLFDKRVRKGKK